MCVSQGGKATTIGWTLALMKVHTHTHTHTHHHHHNHHTSDADGDHGDLFSEGAASPFPSLNGAVLVHTRTHTATDTHTHTHSITVLHMLQKHVTHLHTHPNALI